MSNGLNKVILVGNLADDPELRSGQSGTAVCKLRLATVETFVGRDGQEKTITDWHSVVAFGKLAETAGKLRKGDCVAVDGKLKTSSFDDKDGNKRYKTEVNANSIATVGGGSSGGSPRRPAAELNEPVTEGDDSLPF